MGLFRQQVLDAQASPYGAPLHGVHAGYGLYTLALLALAVGGGWVVLSHDYAEKLTLEGFTQNAHPPNVMHAPVAGRVAALPVRVGQQVVAGQVLVRLDASQVTGPGGAASDLQIAELRVSVDALAKQIRQQRQLQVITRQQLQASLQHLQSRLYLLRQRGSVITQEGRQSQHLLQRYQRLARQGWLANIELERVQENHLAQQRRDIEQRVEVQALLAQQNDVRLQLWATAAQGDSDALQLQHELRSLKARIRRLDALNTTLMLAPADGVVASVGVQPGSPTLVGTRLLTLASAAQASELELWVPAAGIGRVEPGQQVVVRFAGYPHQHFGSGIGEITEVTTVSQTFQGRLAYRAQAQLTRLPANVGDVPVGMAVSGDVQLQRQPIWQWLLQPVQAMWTNW